MSTNSDQGLCFKCLRDGVERPGVIDYCGSLVCQDHYEKDRTLDDELEPLPPTEQEVIALHKLLDSATFGYPPKFETIHLTEREIALINLRERAGRENGDGS